MHLDDETAFSKTVDDSKAAIKKANEIAAAWKKKKSVFQNANVDDILKQLGSNESGDVIVDGVSLPVKNDNGKLYLMRGKTPVASK